MADLDASLGRAYRQLPEEIRGMKIWTRDKLKKRAWAVDNFGHR